MYGRKERDVIRVKVKFCDNDNEPQIKKFAIDPRLTNYEVLVGLLVKGLNIKRDFLIHYLATDDFGEQFYLPLLSDWDLDAAILTASDPLLRLKVYIKPQEKVEWRHSYMLYNFSFEETDDVGFYIDLDEWDIVPNDAPVKPKKCNNIKSKDGNRYIDIEQMELSNLQTINSSNTASFLNQMYQQVEKTVSSVQRAFSNSKLNDSISNHITKPPMSDIEFRNYMDSIGRIVQPEEFRQSVFLGGLEPSLRKVGWRLLLSVYPVGLSGRERLTLLEEKTKQYRSLKHAWKQKFKAGKLTDQEMAQIALVSVDVIRTDRSLNFYSGEKNHQHVAQLFDILATFCIYYPSIGYYQGMSDLASPLLFVQCDEAVAYLCFCSLMRRVHCNFVAKPKSKEALSLKSSNKENGNFRTEQSSIINKLQHLYDLLLNIDRELALFLREKNLGNLFFAHRWVLLEMKREFSFIDSLRLLEVQWASLPQSKFVAETSNEGVSLVEDSIGNDRICPEHSRAYLNKRATKVRCYAVRDMTVICSLIGSQYAPNSSPASSPSYNLSATSETEDNSDFPVSDFNESDSSSSSLVFQFPDNCVCKKLANGDAKAYQKHKVAKNRNHICVADDDRDSRAEMLKERTASNSSTTEDGTIQNGDFAVELPPVDELGHGNPFLMFLCVSLLLEYRDTIVSGVAEASDILMLYQRLNQRHNLAQVLSRARILYSQYLRDQDAKRRPRN